MENCYSHQPEHNDWKKQWFFFWSSEIFFWSSELFYIPHTFLIIYFQCLVKKVPWSNICLCLSDKNKCYGFLILHHFDFENYTVNTSSKEMKLIIKFKRDSKNIEKPLHLKKGVFLIYTPRKLRFSHRQFKSTIQNYSYFTKGFLQIFHFKV